MTILEKIDIIKAMSDDLNKLNIICNFTIKDMEKREVESLANEYDVKMHEPDASTPYYWCSIYQSNRFIFLQTKDYETITTFKEI